MLHPLLYVRHPTSEYSIRVSQKAPTAASRGALTFAALIVLRRSIALGSTALSISSSSASSSSSSTSSLLTEAVVPECVALLLSFLTSVSHNGSSGSGSGHGSAEHAEKCVEALMRAALLGEAPSGGRNGAGTGMFCGQRWAVNSTTPKTQQNSNDYLQKHDRTEEIFLVADKP
jgi:hypothetical protein